MASIHKIRKDGDSIVVTLPREMIRDSGWKVGEYVSISKRGGRLSDSLLITKVVVD